MKYIIMKCNGSTLEVKVPVIFPEFMVHRDVSQYFQTLLRRNHPFTEVRPVSAGFFDVVEGKVSGRSETLGLDSNQEDELTILTYQYTHGQV